jgi:hypothetical protein
MTNDPTRVVNQPALTTSTGRSWLLLGGLFTLIALGVLIPMTALPPRGVALVAAILVAALYLGMLVVRATVPAGRRRLGMMASGMIGLALVSLVASIIVAFAAVGSG